MTNAELEVLRALSAFKNGVAPTSELDEEAGLSHSYVWRCLDALQKGGKVKQLGTGVWSLTDEGLETLERTKGKILTDCKLCEKEYLFPGELGPLVNQERCPECGSKLRPVKSLRMPGLEYPAPEGSPPTRVNRRGQVVYTFESWFDENGKQRCGARTKEGIPCPCPFVQPEGNRCPKHGGRTPKPFRTGRYSEILTETVGKKYEQFLYDPDLLDLRDEVALLRAKLAENPELPHSSIISYADTIGKLVGRIVAREEGLKLTISVDRMQVMVRALSEVIVNELSTCPECGASLAPVRERISVGIAGLKLLEAGE